MLLLPTEETTTLRRKHLYGNLDSRIKTHHNQHRRRRGDRKISNGKGSLGHWHLLQNKKLQQVSNLVFYAQSTITVIPGRYATTTTTTTAKKKEEDDEEEEEEEEEEKKKKKITEIPDSADRLPSNSISSVPL